MLPAAITSWTAAGESIGGTASPPGVSVAWFGLAVIPLRESCWRTSATDTGTGSDALTGPTLTPAGLAEGGAVAAAAPATGSTVCGCARIAPTAGPAAATEPAGAAAPPEAAEPDPVLAAC